MASQPNCSRMIDFDALYLSDNVRTSACERIPDMVASLRQFGFKPNHPLVVSEKSDGRYLVLCGNRRTKGLTTLREQDESAFKAALPTGRIACIVHKGLTEEEEILLRIDHSVDEDRVPLDDWSEFCAIRQLVRAYPGESQEKIALKLGIFKTKGKDKGKRVPNRPYVQVRVNLVRLPEFVQDEYRKLCLDGKDATTIRWADVKDLYKAYNAEYKEYPDGDGPEFSALWDEKINPAPKSSESADSGEEAKALSPESAVQRSQAASSRTVKRILLAVTNQGGDMVALDAAVAAAEADSAVLADIRDYLGPNDYADLVNQSRDARIAREMTAAESEQMEQPEQTEQPEHPAGWETAETSVETE